MPGKTGVDIGTQILDGELFDFDTEVQPLLEVLVGRSLEQAIVEVMHEEEVADLKEQQQRLMAIREQEKAEIRRLEEQERRLMSEKVMFDFLRKRNIQIKTIFYLSRNEE